MAVDSHALDQPCTGTPVLSKEPLFEQKFRDGLGLDPVEGRRCDPFEVQRKFPDRWMAFLHAHFSGPAQVGFTFGVTEKAAEKWWHGMGGPQGAKVALAYSSYPVQARAFLSAVA